MLKRYLVCLTSNREQCEIDTAEIAKRNNAIDYEIDGTYILEVYSLRIEYVPLLVCGDEVFSEFFVYIYT